MKRIASWLLAGVIALASVTPISAASLKPAPADTPAQAVIKLTTCVDPEGGNTACNLLGVTLRNEDGTAATSGGGSGGDASAANQTLQITQETAINTALGTVTASPTANTVLDRLKVINTTLGTPLQAGGNVVVTSNALPTGAATAALQDDTYAPLTPATATAIKSNLAGCTYTAAKFTATDGQQMGLQCGTRGSLIVQLSGGDNNSVVPSTAWGAADAQASSGQSGIVTSGAIWLFNGTTWDRQREVANGADSAGTGILATGVMAQCDDTAPVTVTENQFGNVRMSCEGHQLLERPFASNAKTWHYVPPSGGLTNTTTGVTIQAAGGSGIKQCVTGITLSNSTLGAAGTYVLRDGASGTVIWRGYLDVAARSPYSIPLLSPICGTANTLVELAAEAASVTGAAWFQIDGYSQ